MINTLHITNFQSHKDSELELAPGVNVIVGASDSGKTAIIRALRWLVWNRPSGDAFRSTWGGDTEVEVWVDGFGIKRIKGKQNLYIAGIEEHPDNDPQILEGFGSDVPSNVSELLNIDETNLQMQLDAPFLISSTPGEVASYFNRIAHLDQIDFGIKNLSSWIRTLNNEREAAESYKESYEEELKQYGYLDKFEVDLEELEKMAEEYLRLTSQKRTLESNIFSLETIDEELEEISKVLTYESAVNYIFDVRELIESEQNKHDTLKTQIEQILNIEQSLAVVEAEYAFLPEIDTLLKMHEYRNEIKAKFDELTSLCKTIEGVQSDIGGLNEGLKDLENQFHANMPDRCPLCGK